MDELNIKMLISFISENLRTKTCYGYINTNGADHIAKPMAHIKIKLTHYWQETFLKSNTSLNLSIFLMPVGRNIMGVGRGLAPDGIIQPLSMQPFAIYLVLYTKPA